MTNIPQFLLLRNRPPKGKDVEMQALDTAHHVSVSLWGQNPHEFMVGRVTWSPVETIAPSLDIDDIRKTLENGTEKKLLTYLACPYSHPEKAVMESRYAAATMATAWLIRQRGWNVFSPITHSHPLATIADMRGDWPFWKKIDTDYLALSARMVILCLPGWRESTGVTEEIKIAKGIGCPVFYLEDRGPDNYLLRDTEPIEYPTGV